MARISRDQLFIRAAYLWAKRSTCTRGSVGAVIVQGKHIISTGYNGAPPGMPHCEDVGCEVDPMESFARMAASLEKRPMPDSLGCQRTIHAEANAIAFAANHGISTQGATIYCTHSPCKDCAMLMVSAGIRHFVYAKQYRRTPWDYLGEMGMIWEQVTPGVMIDE